MDSIKKLLPAQIYIARDHVVDKTPSVQDSLIRRLKEQTR